MEGKWEKGEEEWAGEGGLREEEDGEKEKTKKQKEGNGAKRNSPDIQNVNGADTEREPRDPQKK